MVESTQSEWDEVRSVGDFCDQAERLGLNSIVSATDRRTQIMRGRNGIIQLRPGLQLHFSESVDLEDVSIQADCPPSLSVKVFLSGKVDASIGDLKMPMPSQSDCQHWKPVAVFVRKNTKGGQLRKVAITFTPEWLYQSCALELDDTAAIHAFATSHLAMKTWRPSKTAVAIAEQILNPPRLAVAVRKLYLESRSLLLVSEALQVLLDDGQNGQVASLTASHRQKLVSIDTFLDAFDGPLHVDVLARHTGTSANTLRRLVQCAHGQSLSAYVRNKRLERARTALETGATSIAEAAHLAGYESSANFATAFKRKFGISPSQAFIRPY